MWRELTDVEGAKDCPSPRATVALRHQYCGDK
jgi:hypothetical protein